jgi:hypothetical protein
MYPPDDYLPSPRLAAMTDDELIAAGHAAIRSHAADIAAIVGKSRSSIEHGLYGYRWPRKSMSANDISEVLDDASMLLATVQAGMLFEAAVDNVSHARWMRNRHVNYGLPDDHPTIAQAYARAQRARP